MALDHLVYRYKKTPEEALAIVQGCYPNVEIPAEYKELLQRRYNEFVAEVPPLDLVRQKLRVCLELEPKEDQLIIDFGGGESEALPIQDPPRIET